MYRNHYPLKFFAFRRRAKKHMIMNFSEEYLMLRA
jgi:hypothetical protein